MKRISVGLLGVFLALGLAGCGEVPAADQAKAQDETAAQQRADKAQERKAKQTAVFKECSSMLGDFDDSLSSINSRLSVGLPFVDYSKAVGDATVSHDAVVKKATAAGGISDDCIIKVATPLENALKAYVNAYNTWNDCIGEDYCTFDGDTLAKAQKAWTRADTLVTKGETALADLQPA